MITLRCTRKLLKLLGGFTTEEHLAPTSSLGDWYANIIPTVAGELIVFVNEQTLLSVALPIEMIDALDSLTQTALLAVVFTLKA